MQTTKLITKIITLLLIIGLITNYLNLAIIVKAFNKPTNNCFYDTSLTNTFEFKKQELIDEKTKNSKTYKYDNGLIETEIYNKAVHYLENGKYENIDNTLIDKGYYYQNNKNSFLVTFPKTLKDNIALTYQNYYLNINYLNNYFSFF